MDNENLLLIALLAILCAVLLLASGCSLLPLPGIDNHEPIFSAPRVVPHQTNP